MFLVLQPRVRLIDARLSRIFQVKSGLAKGQKLGLDSTPTHMSILRCSRRAFTGG